MSTFSKALGNAGYQTSQRTGRERKDVASKAREEGFSTMSTKKKGEPAITSRMKVSNQTAKSLGFVPGAKRATKREMEVMAAEINKMRNSLPNLYHNSVSIGLLTHEEIKKIASVKVTKKESKDQASTVHDERMGGLQAKSICPQCQTLSSYCGTGHYGYIEFALPQFHPLYLNNRNTTITKILQSVCKSCGQMYLSDSDLKAYGIDRLKGMARLSAIARKSATAKCRHAGIMITVDDEEILDERYKRCNDKIVYNSGAKDEGGKQRALSKDIGVISYTYIQQIGLKKSKSEICTMTAEQTLGIFRMISDEDAVRMGFKDSSVFERFIMRSMLVPPNNTRFPKIIDRVIKPNEMTEYLVAIVGANIELHDAIKDLKDSKREEIEEPVKTAKGRGRGGGAGKQPNKQGTQKTSVSEKNKKLFEAISRYTDYVTKLIQGKSAIVRDIMNAKRGGFCGRAVLSPADNLELGQVAVPEYMVTKLTPSVTVTNENRDYLLKLLGETPRKITKITPNAGPGAGITFEPMDGQPYMLEPGDKVERWLQDGDPVVIDRQPSLHKQNMMCCRAVIWNNVTLGIHLAYTTGTNADFDGDEMSIWAVDEEETDEVLENLFVPRNVMSSQNSFPIVALVMDSLTGTGMMTNDETMVPFSLMVDAHTIIAARSEIITRQTKLDPDFNPSQLYTLRARLRKHRVPELSGKALFSACLPENLNYNKGGVEIQDGILIRGEISKDTVGTKNRSLIQDIYKYYGWERLQKFITDVTRVNRLFLDQRGLSVGLEDCCLAFNPEVEKLIRQKVEEAETKRFALGEEPKDEVGIEEMNKNIRSILNQLKSVGVNLMELLEDDNAFKIMAETGAKGGEANTMQILAAVGQQYYNGQRVKRSMTNNTRTSSHVREGDYSLNSEGLCTHSFHRGLTPMEMFFHFRGGREGLSATATTTSKIGELQRKTGKNTEDTISAPDGSVRMTSGGIIEYLYGNDGFNAAELMFTGPGKVDFVDLKVFERRYNAEYGWLPDYKSYYAEREERLKSLTDEVLSIRAARGAKVENVFSGEDFEIELDEELARKDDAQPDLQLDEDQFLEAYNLTPDGESDDSDSESESEDEDDIEIDDEDEDVDEDVDADDDE